MKLTITFQNGTLAGRSWDLTEGFLTVGRSGTCNVVFDPNAENMVSTKHAYFESKPDGFYLIDTKSTNGTFVNGQRIQVFKLNPGDSIQFGKNGPFATVAIDSQPSFPSAAAPTIESMPPDQPVWGAQFQNNPPLPAQPAMPPHQAQTLTEPVVQPVPNFQNSMNFIGLSNPVVKVEEKSKTGKYIGAAVAIMGFVFFGLVATALITLSLSVDEKTQTIDWGSGIFYAIVASLVAFIPAMIYIIPLVFLDRYDPEPPWLIASAFAWGALVSIVFSAIVNDIFTVVVASITKSNEIGGLASTVISAPVFEELSKGVGVLAILLFFRKEFDDILDGIVYGGVVGLGFATVENVLYYGKEFKTEGSEGLILVFILRGVLAPFCHSTFTAMTGIGCGIARESHRTIVRLLAPIGGYIAAVILHMIWNAVLATLAPVLYVVWFEGNPKQAWIGYVVAYVIIAIPFFLIFLGFCNFIMRRQNRILRETLAIDTARGLISNEQLNTATSAIKSTTWLLGGITAGKFFARWRFLRSVGKLGLSYWHIQRATAAQGQTGSFQSNPVFRAEVEKWRDKV